MATALAIAAAVYGLLVGGLYIGQRHLMYFPSTGTVERQDFAADEYESVTLATEDGLSLVAWHRPPAAKSAPVVVFFHGNAGHIGHRVSKARAFSDAGFGVLLVEYRGYGPNPGRPSESGLYADGQAALGFLAGQGIAEERLVIYGESLGSGVAVEMARGRTVGALVLEAPFSSVMDVAASQFPIVPVRALVRDRYDSAAKMDEVTAPLLVIHGERDRTVPIRFGRLLFAAAGGDKVFKSFAAAGHNDLYDHGAAAEIVTFIKSRMEGG